MPLTYAPKLRCRGSFMTAISKSALITFVCGVALIAPASIGLLGSGVPTLLCPLPTLTVLPAFMLSNVFRNGFWAAIGLPTLLFFGWHPGLFRGEAKVPKRSYVLFLIATVLSVVYFIASWKWGVQYQGVRYTQAVCALNAAWISLLGVAFARARKGTRSFEFSLFLHWMLFAWLGWYAFPYLGELP